MLQTQDVGGVHSHRSLKQDKREYKEKVRQTKREVARAKRLVWENWYVGQNSSEKEKDMFKNPKQMKKEKKDVTGAKYIKDEREIIKIKEEEILERWRCYFENQLNEENEHNLEEVDMVEVLIEEISEEELNRALKGMKSGKALDPTGIISDLMKKAGVIRELTRVFRGIIDKGDISEDWKNSITVSIYKGKGDDLEYGKYRGIRLLEHGIKLFEKVMEDRVGKLVKVDDQQFGFCPGRSTTDAIFIMRQIQEKFSERKKLFHVFVDLEKAFDRVPRRAIGWALTRQKRLVTAVMSLYVESRSRMKTLARTSRDFDIRVGVHQGSALSPLLFITVMEEDTKLARGDGPCLRNLRGAQNFVCPRCVRDEEGGGGGGDDEDVGLEVNGGVLDCYLGDMLDCEVGVERAVRARVAVAWGRWMLRYMAGVRLQDRRSSSEVAEMCGVEDLSVELRTRRLRWFGHVRGVEGGALSEVEMRVGGRWPVGRPKKKWRKCVTEDMNLLGIEEHMEQDRQLWKAVIAHPTPP
ncbi:uncharacterized protein LOC135094941 [Scylla paramamosain]|uniref:uncharacterized protein LOC135094941 n=1 Tax=Scylla paramamosain TaxID=85552 RepID=UPI00308304F6